MLETFAIVYLFMGLMLGTLHTVVFITFLKLDNVVGKEFKQKRKMAFICGIMTLIMWPVFLYRKAKAL